MNIFSKLTLKTLKENRTRTLVTIAGIIISAALFTSITTLVVCLHTYIYNSIGAREGFFHGKIMAITQEEVDKYAEYEHLESYFTSRNIGYAELEKSENEEKPYIFLFEPDEDFLKNMSVNVTLGHLPERDDEILLPDHINSNGGVNLEIGQQIKLQVGRRVSEGEYLWQDTSLVPGKESIEKNFTKTYTVCGFYQGIGNSEHGVEPYNAPGYAAIVKDQDVPNAPIDFYYNMDSGKHAMAFYNEMSEKQVNILQNTDLIMAQGADEYDNVNEMIYAVAVLLIGIVVFASVALIYNAFAISVSSRAKQFGLLSSVGATKRQIKTMVLYESMFLSAVGIPVGILCGLGSVALLLHFIGDKFTFLDLGAENVKMVFDFSPLSVISAAVIAFITVLISAYIPSKRCANVTAIEAIRQNNDIKTEEKEKIKTSKIFSKVFGFNGTLAEKYMSRDKKKYRTIVVSLSMSVILIILSGALSVNVLSAAEDVLLRGTADMQYCINTAESLETYKDITVGFDLAQDTAEEAVKLGYAKDYIIGSSVKSSLEQRGGKISDTMYPVSADLYFINDEAFDSYAKKIGADPNDFKDEKNPKGILYAKTSRLNNGNTTKNRLYDIFEEPPESFTGNYTVFSMQEEKEKKPLTCYVGAVADVRPDIYYDLDPTLICRLIYPISAFKSLNLENPDYYSVCASFISDTPYELEKYITANGKGTGDGIFTNNIYDETKNERDKVTAIKVFAYGFIILIALIAVANVFNTISTGIILRKKEFAMLKSVGMTDRGVIKILFLENLISGLKGIIAGVLISAVVCGIVYVAALQSMDIFFRVPWGSVIAAVAVVLIVTFISTLYAASKLKKENILDSLRGENI